MDQQEYNQMITELKKLVASGDVESMRYLGDLYYQASQRHSIELACAFWTGSAQV